MVPGLSAAGNSLLLAWNRHDAAALAALWHENGDLIDAHGRVAHGRAEVEQYFRDELKNTTLELLSDSTARFVGRDLRLEDWDVEINGRQEALGLLPPAKGHFFLVYTRSGPGSTSVADSLAKSPPDAAHREGAWWRLASVRAYAFQEPAWQIDKVPGESGEELLRVGGEVTKPEPISAPPPVYTQVARRAGVQGIVVIEAVIDQDGSVTPGRVLKGLPLGLDRAAVDAVRKWTFKPATRRGKPVKVAHTLVVTFRLPAARPRATKRDPR